MGVRTGPPRPDASGATRHTSRIASLNSDLCSALQLYTDGVLCVSLEGDYNGNASVDSADYSIQLYPAEYAGTDDRRGTGGTAQTLCPMRRSVRVSGKAGAHGTYQKLIDA
jgi:hypothetical protein